MDVSRPELEEQQQQEQRVGAEAGVAVGVGAGEEVAGARGGAGGRWTKSNRAKRIGHRSQSSPSSLTTHKFGLRPTPSPPRLIIDHQTGDIVESYPQQPVYLRTYQPLEDEDEEEEEAEAEEEEEEEQEEEGEEEPLSEDSQAAKRRRQLDEYKRLLRHRQHRDEGFLSSQDELQAPEMSQNRHFRPAIPPPHTGKVYFAPPSVSAGHLFGPPASRRESQEEVEEEVEVEVERQQSGAHNQSFRRALNKLNEAARTDIAILEPRNETGERQWSGWPAGKQEPQIKVTATSAGRASALLAQKSPREPAPRLVVPAIEHFRLYDLCYQLRALLVVLLSGLVLYLLAVPLYADCSRHRPTLTYVSLMLACVNLTCILVFSLFWYCSGVTRTLYANLSSSAFIITIYSILVALNLALGVLFFFTNTCHFQRLAETPLALGLERPEPSLLASQVDQELVRIRRHHQHHHSTKAPPPEEPSGGGGGFGEPEAPDMSPLEAAWEWSCERALDTRRHFRHFLLRYDLRFIGALHALCAVCLQYLAMKVAVVRSHFCSPLAHYL